jgi:hypothetical protein
MMWTHASRRSGREEGAGAGADGLGALERLFHKAMVRVYERAKSEAGYNATRFIQMVAEQGGVAAARVLIGSKAPSDGFVALWQARRLDLTVEALVLEPNWFDLFTAAEREAARQRLTDYGYRF